MEFIFDATNPTTFSHEYVDISETYNLRIQT